MGGARKGLLGSDDYGEEHVIDEAITVFRGDRVVRLEGLGCASVDRTYALSIRLRDGTIVRPGIHILDGGVGEQIDLAAAGLLEQPYQVSSQIKVLPSWVSESKDLVILGLVLAAHRAELDQTDPTARLADPDHFPGRGRIVHELDALSLDHQIKTLILKGHRKDAVHALAFSATEPTLISSGAKDCRVCVWSVRDHATSLASTAEPEPHSKFVPLSRPSPKLKPRHVLRGHCGEVCDVAFAPDYGMTAVLDRLGGVKVFSSESGEFLA